MNSHAPKSIKESDKEQAGSKSGAFFPESIVAKHQKTMVVWQHENQQQYETKQIELPVEPSCPLGEKGDDLEENQLQQITREGEDDAENDLN